MSGIDQADQLRSYYTTQRIYNKTWKPLWYFLLDTTIVNSYKITHCLLVRPFGEPQDHNSHKAFRKDLATGLFEHSERHGQPPSSVKTLATLVHPAAPRDHGGLVRLGLKARYCEVCKRAGRKGKQATPRKALTELSGNAIRGQKRREFGPRGLFGCKLCDIPLCNNQRCWNEHIRAIR